MFDMYECLDLYTRIRRNSGKFSMGHVVGTLNLSIYVLRYGPEPMIISPLSQVITTGRQQIYMTTFMVFMII